MIIIVHQNSKGISEIFKDAELLDFKSRTICAAMWEMAQKFPEEVIVWVEKKFFHLINKQEFLKVFFNKRIMASYAIKSNFFSENIGYIDQMPFININRNVKYPTWLMSTDIGGINADILSAFKSKYERIKGFGYLINSIAKTGQQNGLFCYSIPDLIVVKKSDELLLSKAGLSEELSFVYSNYKTIWTFVLLWCLWRYENKYPLAAFLKSLFGEKYFGSELNLPFPNFVKDKRNIDEDSIDVIIPTIERPEYLKNVLEDLNNQTHVPNNVIVIEQNLDASSQLEHLNTDKWLFNLKILTVDTIGVCNARNIGLNEVTSRWIFFADDDIRFSSDLLENLLIELGRLGCDAINMNCLQEREKTIFHKIKQWGSFGSGTSIVKSEFAKKCHFPVIFEKGYGEDSDYGNQLRNKGCDIIYHPEIKILHLKASSGGFRSVIDNDYTKSKDSPKPAPTIMALALRHYSPQQLKGFKISLFLKFYKEKTRINPFSFISSMQKRWELSEKRAQALLRNDSKITDFNGYN